MGEFGQQLLETGHLSDQIKQTNHQPGELSVYQHITTVLLKLFLPNPPMEETQMSLRTFQLIAFLYVLNPTTTTTTTTILGKIVTKLATLNFIEIALSRT